MCADDYRAYALECLMWACDASNPIMRNELLELAKAWERAALLENGRDGIELYPYLRPGQKIARNAAAEPN